MPTILIIAPEGMLGTAWTQLLKAKAIPTDIHAILDAAWQR